MSFFADTISDLRYAGGIVSFSLKVADRPAEQVAISIPFGAVEAMSVFLQTELPRIRDVHSNWVEYERDRLREEVVPELKSEAKPLGPLIGSV